MSMHNIHRTPKCTAGGGVQGGGNGGDAGPAVDHGGEPGPGGQAQLPHAGAWLSGRSIGRLLGWLIG